MAKNVSDEIKWIQNVFSLPRSAIKLAAHSLGAHVMGIAGEILYIDGLGKVAHIIGLDPAGPLFDEYFDEGRLSKDDADHVMCIYTDPGILGTSIKNCTENLYPCTIQSVQKIKLNCSDKLHPNVRHDMARRLFIYLLLGRNFLAKKPVKDCFVTWILRCLMKIIGRGFVIYFTTDAKFQTFVLIALVIDVFFGIVQGFSKIIKTCFHHFKYIKICPDNCERKYKTCISWISLIVAILIVSTITIPMICYFVHDS